jgi:tetratricopeptide (TPR) repeat protein
MNKSVQTWLDELTATPYAAIQKLVLGYAGVSAWSRSSLRESFVEIFQTHAAQLDAAVAEWLNERLMKLPPEKTPTLVWSSQLQDLFSAIASLPLPKVARLLRDRLRDLRTWLRPLRTDEGSDPEAAYLAALAWAETNQHLEGMWQGLVFRRQGEPAYYTDIGLLGLRKTRDEHTKQPPPKAPFLLLATLIDLADAPGIAKDDWILTTGALLGGYHYSLETWVREFEPVLEARQDAQNGPKWLKKILPLPSAFFKTPINSPRRISPPFTLDQCNWFVSEVRRSGPDLTDRRFEIFLNNQRSYANTTNNPYYLVRTFNRLAEAAKNHNPDWAVARAEEALDWHGGDPRNWTVLARCLFARSRSAKKQGDFERAKTDQRKALDTLWTARFRIPYNTYIRAELGRLHRETGDLLTAESIYREGSAEFPNESSLRCGLAEVLAAGGHMAEAEAVYRQTVIDLPNERVPRDGLAALLQDSGRFGEAEYLYRETATHFPDDDRARTSLGDILFRRSAAARNEAEREEAHKLYIEAAQLGSAFAVARLKSFNERWLEFAEQPQLLSESPKPIEIPESAEDLSAMGPTQRLGRALLFQWQATRDEQIDERERLFAKSETLLSVPDELTGECRTAFVEARGFLLLARGRSAEARAYFEQQLAALPRPSLGLRLGFGEARTRLGETLSETDEAELAAFGAEGSILPLVLRVLRLLESGSPDYELRNLLLGLYPRIRDLAGMPPAELGDDEELVEAPAAPRLRDTPDTMMARLLEAGVFRPAEITTRDDLFHPGSIPRVRISLKSRRDDIFSVAEKLALAA